MKKGFTLVELSIVLVIIGLLIGGILAAQSMIDSAKINKTIKEFQQYNVAGMMFQENFNCIPGDCHKDLGVASRFIYDYGTNTYSSNGTGDSNGNGIIGDYEWPAGYYSGNYALVGPESYNFWAMLEQLKYLPITLSHSPHTFAQADGPGTASPTPPVAKKILGSNGTTTGGGWWVYGMDGQAGNNFPMTPTCKNIFTIGYPYNTNYGIVSNQSMAALDTKLDDGLPLTGRVFAISSTYYHNGTTYIAKGPTDATYGVNCTNATTPVSYKTSYTGNYRSCDIVMCADF